MTVNINASFKIFITNAKSEKRIHRGGDIKTITNLGKNMINH